MAQNNPQMQKQAELQQFRKNISINTYMSIPFIGLNFYHSIFFVIYIVITVALLVYKVQKYPMPPYCISMQAIIIAFFIVMHVLRGRMSTLCIIRKDSRKAIFYLIVTLFIIPLYVFQLRLQTYVLLADFILNWIGIGIVVLQAISAAWVFKVLLRKKSAV